MGRPIESVIIFGRYRVVGIKKEHSAISGGSFLVCSVQLIERELLGAKHDMQALRNSRIGGEIADTPFILTQVNKHLLL